MASFHGKIGCKGQRKRKNKNYRCVSFLPDRQKRKFQKNSKNIEKIEKIEKYHYGFIPSQNRWENA